MDYREDYIKKFINSACDRSLQQKRIESALRHAMDIRKFEIELYWKRTGYFWAFIVVIYGVYGWVQGGLANIQISVSGNNLINVSSQASDSLIPLVISALGVIVTFAWNLVNRGSKFWQNNWERHVDVLEDYIHGPLYKTILFEKNDFKSYQLLTNTSAYPFSVSKINQWLSIIALWLAAGIFCKEILCYAEIFKRSLDSKIIALICLCITIFFLVQMFKSSKSNLGKDFKNKYHDNIDSENKQIHIAYRE